MATRIQRIPATATVTGPDVEHPVRTEGQRAAVVVAELVVHRQPDAGAGRIRHVRVRRRRVVGGDDLSSVSVGVVDEEAALLGSRQERQTEEPSFATGQHEIADVEEGALHQLAIADQPDAPALLDHEERCRLVGAVGDVDRALEAVEDRAHGEGRGRTRRLRWRGWRSARRRR